MSVKKSFPQKLEESRAMLAARDAAGGTPEEVRQAFLNSKRALPGVELEPFSIGIMWLLEEIDHPLVRKAIQAKDEDGKPRFAEGKPVYEAQPIGFKDIARALYIFADSEGAHDALERGLTEFDSGAFVLAKSVPPQTYLAASNLIPQIIQEGLASLPGGGASNPPGTSS
jgi:hypothetical protein